MPRHRRSLHNDAGLPAPTGQEAAQHQGDEDAARPRRIPVVSAAKMPVGTVDGVDEDGGRLLDVDVPDRPVGDPVREQPLDRVDVSLPRTHLVLGLVKEAPIGLLVESDQERQVVFCHLAHGVEHLLQALGSGATPGHGGPERRAECLLVVAGEQTEDLLPAEATAVQGRPRDAGLVRDPRQGRTLPASGRDCAPRTLDHTLFGVLDECHRPWDDSVARTVRQCHTALIPVAVPAERAGRAEGGNTVPMIEVKLYDRRVTEESVPKMIEALTNALAESSGAAPSTSRS